MSNNYDIYEAIKDLMLIDPFYGNLSVQLEKIESMDVDTACVALKNSEEINISLVVNPKYFYSLEERKRLGLIKHEMLHVAYFHLFLCHKYQDKDKFNIAADLVVNQYLAPDMIMPNWITFDKFPNVKFAQHESVDYYYTILDEAEKNKDKHVCSLLNHLRDGKPAVCSHKLWGQEISDDIQDLAKKQLEYQIVDIYENALNKNIGNIPGHLHGLIRDFNKIMPPIVCWKRVIRQFASASNKIQMKMSKNKLNKRYEDSGFPAPLIKRKRKLLVAIDTSGSVGSKELQEFLCQIHFIWKTDTTIDIIQCDTKIHDISPYSGRKPNFKIYGRGGTSFDAPVDYLNKNNYNGLIYFTDGYGVCNIKARKNILWVVTNKNASSYVSSLPGVKIFING